MPHLPIDFCRSLKKAELHVHLEGSVEPRTVLEIDPALDIQTVEQKYTHQSFAEFIESYVWISRLLTGPAEYRLITRRLLERLETENVVYAEVNLSVGVMLWKQQDPLSIFQAVVQEAARSQVKVRWIFDAVRHFGPEHGQEVAELAVALRDQGVIGFGIGGDEQRGPAEKFIDAFSYARRNGLKLVPHAGETAGPESVWAAIRCGADRIGHGFRSVEDPSLLRYLQEHQVPLEVCLSSNICTGVVASIAQHPLRQLFDAGVPVVLGSDDPALFHTTLTDEYELAAEHLRFSERELRELASNSLRYAFDL